MNTVPTNANADYLPRRRPDGWPRRQEEARALRSTSAELLVDLHRAIALLVNASRVVSTVA